MRLRDHRITKVVPIPIPLANVSPVAAHEIDSVRVASLTGAELLFEVLLYQCPASIRLDARFMPYRIIDGKQRIHVARLRGLKTVPALLELPDVPKRLSERRGRRRRPPE